MNSHKNLSELSLDEILKQADALYSNDKKTEASDKEAFALYQEAANRKNRHAFFRLGRMYDDGRGIAKDEKKAVEYYQIAAAEGDARAQNNLGLMHAEGCGVGKDEKKAVELYQLAVAQGCARAKVNLGMMYADGRGIEKDEKKAMDLFLEAAADGYEYAQLTLAVNYEQGLLSEKDEKKSFEFYRTAAAQGYTPAQNGLGRMYERGIGVAQDEQKAIECYHQAAEQGNDQGLENLVKFYKNNKEMPDIIYHIALLSEKIEPGKENSLTEQEVTTIQAKFIELSTLEVTLPPQNEQSAPPFFLLLLRVPKNLEKLQKLYPDIYQMYASYQSHLEAVGDTIRALTPLPPPLKAMIIDQLLAEPLNKIAKKQTRISFLFEPPKLNKDNTQSEPSPLNHESQAPKF